MTAAEGQGGARGGAGSWQEAGGAGGTKVLAVLSPTRSVVLEVLKGRGARVRAEQVPPNSGSAERSGRVG